jgi:predicted phage-related endonuclease
MQTHDLIQGSPAWHAHRANFFNASDAPAMMGASPYQTRSDLIKELATGITEEPDSFTLALYAEGHRFEILARPIAEGIVGEDLYPVVGSEGRLSASFDGLTMLGDVNFEHKRLNKALREALSTPDCTGADLPMAYQVQMEQQHMVSDAERTLFMASDWTPDGQLIEELHCWYTPNPELAARIAAGWEQLDKDVCAYAPEGAAPVKPIGRTLESLPALTITVRGSVVASNLDAYREHALAVFAEIKTELTTDQDFADADKTVKWCGDVEARLVAAKENALGQTATIDALFRTIDDIAAEARRVRLKLEKTIEAEKKARRETVITDHQAKLDAHVKALNARLGTEWIARRIGPFSDAIKGKRTIESCKESAGVALVTALIDLSQLADRLDLNRKSLVIDGTDWFFLFADFASLGAKPAEDFAALATLRIQQHQAAEAARKAAEDLKQVRAAVAAIKWPEAPAPVAAPIADLPMPPVPAPAPAPVRSVASFSGGFTRPAPAPAPTAETVWINTATLVASLGVPITSAIAEELGFAGTRRTGPGLWWPTTSVMPIGLALIERIRSRIEEAVAA